MGQLLRGFLKDEQDYTNLNLMQTGFDIAETGSIFGGGKRGIEREILNKKDAKKLNKLTSLPLHKQVLSFSSTRLYRMKQ